MRVGEYVEGLERETETREQDCVCVCMCVSLSVCVRACLSVCVGVCVCLSLCVLVCLCLSVFVLRIAVRTKSSGCLHHSIDQRLLEAFVHEMNPGGQTIADNYEDDAGDNAVPL